MTKSHLLDFLSFLCSNLWFIQIFYAEMLYRNRILDIFQILEL